MAAGSDSRPGADDTPPHQGWLAAARSAPYVLAALPSFSHSCGAGSAVFVLGHHSTGVCCCYGYPWQAALPPLVSAPRRAPSAGAARRSRLAPLPILPRLWPSWLALLPIPFPVVLCVLLSWPYFN